MNFDSKEAAELFVKRLWHEHPGKCAGGLAGVMLGICILMFGFWNVLFVMLLGLAGLFVGMNVDREGDTWQNIKDCIPRDIHRLR